TNAQFGGSFSAADGPAALYLRAEFQHAPTAPALSQRSVTSLQPVSPLRRLSLPSTARGCWTRMLRSTCERAGNFRLAGKAFPGARDRADRSSGVTTLSPSRCSG